MTRTMFIVPLLALLPLMTYADHSVEIPSTHEAEEPCSIFSNLTIGSRGDDVVCLQKHLIEDGLLHISAPSGYFGVLTKKAVIAWQEEKSITATGVFGSVSRGVFGNHAQVVTAPAPMQMHSPIDVSTWPSVPSVAITLHKDSMSGWNLEIVPTNFRFAPEHVNGAVLPNEGHVHLLVDGKKISRVYGSWTHLPKELFVGLGTHEVVVTLNANDHSDIVLQGNRIEARGSIVLE